MNWTPITNIEEIEKIKEQSFHQPQVIFKHSTRCSISSMAKSRLERSDLPPGIQFHYLDLLAHRNISGSIAAIFQVAHQSPQILLIKNGECIYEESHSGIDMEEIAEQAK
jgi:bacillithiol system protein YtxJ